jgi:hypothetical protein
MRSYIRRTYANCDKITFVIIVTRNYGKLRQKTEALLLSCLSRGIETNKLVMIRVVKLLTLKPTMYNAIDVV